MLQRAGARLSAQQAAATGPGRLDCLLLRAACRYDVYLFSKPDTLLAWASLPVVKVMQIRYVLDSLRTLAAKMNVDEV